MGKSLCELSMLNIYLNTFKRNMDIVLVKNILLAYESNA